MPDGERIATFLQISDLHIGTIKPESRDVVYPQPLGSLVDIGLFKGLRGHDPRALEHLDAFQVQLKGEDPMLLVTGDLTAYGSWDQYETADTFLGSRLDGNFVGLDVTSWLERAIPGNHDHWNGTPWMFGGPTAAFVEYFKRDPAKRPFVRLLTKLPGDRRVMLCGIGTDAEVNVNGSQRAFAIGSFVDQLDTLAKRKELADGPNADEIRVLMIHHSWDHRKFLLSIDQKSRARLDRFCVEHDIAVLLTGHLHRALVKCFRPAASGDLVLEARCGTTTQKVDSVYEIEGQANSESKEPQDTVPEKRQGIESKEQLNTLLVHRIFDTGNELNWHAEMYVRTRKGFVLLKKHPSFTVWPRSR